MRWLLVPIWILGAFAQQPAAPAKAAEPAPAPAPTADDWLTGDVEFGYRWVPGVGGNFQSYRSIVNLGEGPKLLGLNFTIADPKQKLFDRIDGRMYNWGGDPYNTAHLGILKRGVYDFNFNYRNIAYFNALPSFANPFAPAGFDENSFDTQRRFTDFSLDIFPGKHIIPYLAYSRDHGQGRGIATFVQDGNEFAVPDTLDDNTNNFRGGVRFEYNRWHLTVEQGRTSFDDDQALYENVFNTGNRSTPFLGQPLTLSKLTAAYRINGDANYTRAMITASPLSWLNVSGQFLYSQPQTNATYTSAATGNFVAISQLLFYSGQTDLGIGAAKQPHVTANAGFEMRPFRRLRIIESWITDRFHDAALGTFATTIVPAAPAPPATTAASLPARQIVNYNQNQVDVLYDITSKITLRGGYRRVWGDATVPAGQLSQLGDYVSGQLGRNAGIAGLTFRKSQKLSTNLDFEGASSDRIYFRTSLNTYYKVRARARYQPITSLSLQANFALLSNQNPTPGINLDFLGLDGSLALYWTPASGKRITAMGEYDRSTVRSNINYLLPPFFTPSVSAYRDFAHTATSAVDVMLPGYAGLAPKLTVGGSLFISSGSRPTRYYQPLFRMSVPVSKRVNWNTEWRYYGFGEAFYLYEGFRAQVIQTGLRVSK
jgi:hypothetical protein